jgi:hypothetical protein
MNKDKSRENQDPEKWESVKKDSETEAKDMRPWPENEEKAQVKLKSFEGVKVGVVVGPGGALTSSSIGFIKALEQAKADVVAVAGIGWGSFITALYAHKGTTNAVEWSLYKLYNQDLYKKSLFKFDSKDFNRQRVNEFIADQFAGAKVESLKKAFVCPSQTTKSPVTYLEVKGEVSSVLAQCLYYPPFAKKNQLVYAAPYSVDRLLTWMKKQNVQYILVLNSMGNRKLVSSESMARLSDNERLLWKEMYYYYKRLKYNVKPSDEIPINWVDINSAGNSIFSFPQWKQIMEDGYLAGRDLSRQLGF